jgi:prepilin-type N-terminal cleavage/methylation domain-containing protein
MIDKKLRQQLYQNAEAGYTLIESIIAMLIISMMAVSFLPIFASFTANRVQAKRVALAGTAVRAYIDGVKSGSIRHPTYFAIEPNSIAEVNPTGTLTCDPGDDGYYCSEPTFNANGGKGEFYCIDNDSSGDCETSSVVDLVLHVGSYNCTAQFYQVDDSETDPNVVVNHDLGYILDVRVYRADGFKDNEALKRSKGDDSQLQAASGLGNPKKPLIEVTTQVTTGETNYYELEKLLDCES